MKFQRKSFIFIVNCFNMKVLFLIQSCNEERYINEEELIKQTWLTRLRKNCDYYFYRGDGDNEIKGDTIFLNCNDDLKSTFQKTIMAMSIFKEENYDFIIRTNTSTWVNMELLMETLKNMDSSERFIYGGDMVVNANTSGIPFMRGNFLIFNKTIIKDIFEALKIKPHYLGIDDITLALTLFRYYKTINVDYLSIFKTLNHITYDDTTDESFIDNCIYVRCLEYIKETNSSDILKKLDDIYINKKTIIPNKIQSIETFLGPLTI